MYLKDFLEKYKEEQMKIFVDMDGVIADYNVMDVPGGYDKKRPLYLSLTKLEEISKMENVELYILSVSRMSNGIEEKNIWLDKYAPFFKKENRIIIARQDNNFEEAKVLKEQYLANLERDGSILIVIDDDPRVLKEIKEKQKDIVLLKDTVLVD